MLIYLVGLLLYTEYEKYIYWVTNRKIHERKLSVELWMSDNAICFDITWILNRNEVPLTVVSKELPAQA